MTYYHLGKYRWKAPFVQVKMFGFFWLKLWKIWDKDVAVATVNSLVAHDESER